MDGLTQSVIEYIKKNDTDYAIMINGAWGSGKTYYWNNILKENIESIKINEKNLNTIYVSLYGINSIDEISKSIFVQAFAGKHELLKKLVNSKIGSTIPEVGKILMNGASMFGLSIGEKEIDLSKFTSFENTVLCFDDLERANIEVSEILGFINSLVEHDHIKTIIIANESEITDKIAKRNYELKALTAIALLDKTKAFEEKTNTFTRDKEKKKPNSELIMEIVNDTFDKTNEYKRIKEKLIGKTLTYIPNYESIIDNIIKQYNYNSALNDFLIENKNTILNTFNVSDTWNLRILKQSLNDFEVLYNNLLDEFPELTDKTVIQTLLIFTLALSFETKSGNINPRVFRELKSSSDYISEIYGLLLTKENTDSPIIAFNNKYFGGGFAKQVFFKFVEVYVSTGIFNKEIMINEINDFTKDSDTHNMPCYRKLFYNPYWELTDEEFEIALNETYQVVKNGDMHYVCYFRGYVTFQAINRQGLLKDEMKNFDKDFIDGLEKAKNKFEPVEDLSMEFILSEDSDLRENETLKLIKQRIIEINTVHKEEEMKIKVEQLFELLNEDVVSFKKEIDRNFFLVPIFYYYDIHKLFNKIKLMNNGKLVDLRNFIDYRYKHYGSQLKEDYSNLNLLRKLIEEYTADKGSSLSASIMKELGKTLNRILASI